MRTNFPVCACDCVRSAPSRRYYITRSFIYDKAEKVEALLERLRRLRAAHGDETAVQEKTAGHVHDEASVADTEVEEAKSLPDEKKMRLLDSG